MNLAIFNTVCGSCSLNRNRLCQKGKCSEKDNYNDQSYRTASMQGIISIWSFWYGEGSF